MRNFIFIFLSLSMVVVSCRNGEQRKNTATADSLQMPYTATLVTNFNDHVSDSDLLLVLNSYKYWETGDWDALRSTMGDSMEYAGFDGTQFIGPADSLRYLWKNWRDSISSVKITMTTWMKSHPVEGDDGRNYILTWLKEIDTYKNGKVDSAYYQDTHSVKDGKIDWYSSYRQERK